MTTRCLTMLLFCAMSLSTGCVPGGSDGGGDGPDGGAAAPDGGLPGPEPAPADVDAYLTARASLICDLILACELRGDEALVALARSAPEGCVRYFEAVYANEIDGEEINLDRWHPQAFEGCRAAVVATCTQPEDIPACTAAYHGGAALGDACREGSKDCGLDGICEPAVDAEDACDAVCTARRAPGEPCGYDDQCALGPDLDGHCAMGPDDFEGVCAPLTVAGGAAAGAPCGYLAAPDDYRLVGCARGGWCDAGYRAAGTCRAPLAIGEACDRDGPPCDGGLCDGVCIAPDVSNMPGAPCGDRDLPACNPFAGLGCDFATEQCVATDGQLGAWCGWAGGLPCAPGLYCRGAVCEAQVMPGGACDPFDEFDPCRGGRCVSGEGDEGTCVADDDGFCPAL